MNAGILSIPIGEIFEPKCGCPICRMTDELERRALEYITGAAMMEPDIRIETNKSGFCHEHFCKLLKQKNRLSVALMTHTHLEEVQKKLFESKNLLEGKGAKAKKGKNITESCFICDNVNWGIGHLTKSALKMYASDKAFKELFSEQEYLCLPHYIMLCESAKEQLPKKELALFIKAADKLTESYLKTLCGDVEHYTTMYDYRNSGPNADWKNSKDSLERAVKFLTGKDVK